MATPGNKKDCLNRRDFIRYLREEIGKAKVIVFYSGAKATQHRDILQTLETFIRDYPNANFLYLDVVNVKSVANQLGITDENVPTVILYRYGGDAPVWFSGNNTEDLRSKVLGFLGPSNRAR